MKAYQLYIFPKSHFYQEYTASVFLCNKPIVHLLIDSSATTCIYVHKLESNQKCQENKRKKKSNVKSILIFS